MAADGEHDAGIRDEEAGPLSSNVHPLAVGTTFRTWKDLKRAVVDYGVSSGRVFCTAKKDKSKMKLKCRMQWEKGCPWRLRASLLTSTDTITITRVNFAHTCEATDHDYRPMHNNADRLADKIFQIIATNRQTRVSVLRDTAQALVHPDIDYHTAYRAKRRCIHWLDGNAIDSFCSKPDQLLLTRDPPASAEISAPSKKPRKCGICHIRNHDRRNCPVLKERNDAADKHASDEEASSDTQSSADRAAEVSGIDEQASQTKMGTQESDTHSKADVATEVLGIDKQVSQVVQTQMSTQESAEVLGIGEEFSQVVQTKMDTQESDTPSNANVAAKVLGIDKQVSQVVQSKMGTQEIDTHSNADVATDVVGINKQVSEVVQTQMGIQESAGVISYSQMLADVMSSRK